MIDICHLYVVFLDIVLSIKSSLCITSPLCETQQQQFSALQQRFDEHEHLAREDRITLKNQLDHTEERYVDVVTCHHVV